MADLGEEAFSSQMKVVATFLRLLEELMRNKQQDLRYGTKTQRRGILGRMKDFVGGIFKKVYDGTFGRLSRNGKDYGQLDLNDPAVAKLFADTMKQMGIGKLTGRTLISITVALGLSIAVAVYMNLVLKIDPTDHLEFIYAVSLPCWCCGFWKPHGLPFEQFALLWLQHQLSDNRLFYKPSMFKSGFVKTPDEITQSRKGKLYDKSTRKFLDGTNGLEAYSPRAGRVIY